MPSLNPDTMAPRYVQLRQALRDGRITTAEVKQKIAPFARELRTDRLYRDTLERVADGTYRLPADGGVELSASAKKALQKLLGNP